MLSVPQFRADILRPTLARMGSQYTGQWAENLILGTIAQESNFVYIRQTNGPALGLIQMEPDTLDDLYDNYLNYRSHTRKAVDQFLAPIPGQKLQLQSNLAYMCAVCRMHYWRVPFNIPETVPKLAAFWKRHYNTEKGRGTAVDFLVNYRKFVVTK